MVKDLKLIHEYIKFNFFFHREFKLKDHLLIL